MIEESILQDGMNWKWILQEENATTASSPEKRQIWNSSAENPELRRGSQRRGKSFGQSKPRGEPMIVYGKVII